MARARGSDATMQFAYETTYGTPPADDYVTLPFVSSTLGATQGLIESDLLGQGRAPFDPTKDVIVNDGDVVVPLDLTNFGYWLRLLLGAPVTTGGAEPYFHYFSNLQATVPSASIPIGHPRVPSYSTNYGVRANTLRVQQQRGGLVNATIGCVAKGETTPAGTTIIPAPDAVDEVVRFAQASGSIKLDGVVIGSIVDGSFTYSNNLDKIETIRADGEIEEADLGMPAATGQLRARFADHAMLNKAIAGTPVAITHQWKIGEFFSLSFQFPRVFLPRPKRTIDGPGPVMAPFDWQAASDEGILMDVSLITSASSF